MEVDSALAKLGSIGRWQVRYYTMISAACMVLPSFHMLVINYIGNCKYTVHAQSNSVQEAQSRMESLPTVTKLHEKWHWNSVQ